MRTKIYHLEARSVNNPVSWFFPVSLGLIVLNLVVIEAPISMLSLNAARDLGPRIMAALLGFGKMAFPGPRADIWVTTLVPVVGAIAATFFYDYVMLPYFPKPKAK